jgi:hypothetical protein
MLKYSATAPSNIAPIDSAMNHGCIARSGLKIFCSAPTQPLTESFEGYYDCETV